MVEFGPDPERRGAAGGARPVPAQPGRRPPAGAGLAAALGAVAVFASLISEWQVTTDRRGRASATARSAAGCCRPTWPTWARSAPAYLAGLFLLVAAVVLTMFGPPAGRRYARLAGLSVGGVLLGLLAALAVDAGRHEPGHRRASTSCSSTKISSSSAYGRGLWCAFAGVARGLLALYLADRHARPVEPGRGAGRDEEPPGLAWRRPPAPSDERPPEEPFGLTVAPGASRSPRPREDRDKPQLIGTTGISGC